MMASNGNVMKTQWQCASIATCRVGIVLATHFVMLRRGLEMPTRQVEMLEGV